MRASLAQALGLATAFCAALLCGFSLWMDAESLRGGGVAIGPAMALMLLWPITCMLGCAAFLITVELIARCARQGSGLALRAAALLSVLFALATAIATLFAYAGGAAGTFADAHGESPTALVLSLITVLCVIVSLVLIAVILFPGRRRDVRVQEEAEPERVGMR